jgi:hypothetical protein
VVGTRYDGDQLHGRLHGRAARERSARRHGAAALAQRPLSFIEEVLHDRKTGKPFVLLEAERVFMRHAFALDHNGRLLHPEQCYGAPKKSGKTTLAGIIVLVWHASNRRFVDSVSDRPRGLPPPDRPRSASSELPALTIKHGSAKFRSYLDERPLVTSVLINSP